jgi:hypothetical protein
MAGIYEVGRWDRLRCHNVVMLYECDYRWGFGLDIGFTDHFTTRLGTSNYSATANLYTLQITTTLAKFFQPAVPSPAAPRQRL